MGLGRPLMPNCGGWQPCGRTVVAARPGSLQIWGKVCPPTPEKPKQVTAKRTAYGKPKAAKVQAAKVKAAKVKAAKAKAANEKPPAHSQSKLVTVKRSGRNKKVAVSHFGKRQLKLPGSPDKPKPEQPDTSARSKTGPDDKEEPRKSARPQDLQFATRPVIKLQQQPIISNDGTRQELRETIQLYRVPALSALTLRQPAQQPQQHQMALRQPAQQPQQHPKAKQEHQKGQQFQAQGRVQLANVKQISAVPLGMNQNAYSQSSNSKKEEQRLAKLGRSLLPNGADKRDFAAAGVIVTSFGKPDGHLRVLMAQEKNRKSKWYQNLVPTSNRRGLPYGLLGGKRKQKDGSPQATALRELSEETAGLLNKHTVKLSDTVVFLNGPALYYVFFCKLEDQDDLPEKFAQRIAHRSAKMERCDTESLAWVPLRELARWPRSEFFDRVMRSTAVPARLCLQQQEHDRKLLSIKQ